MADEPVPGLFPGRAPPPPSWPDKPKDDTPPRTVEDFAKRETVVEGSGDRPPLTMEDLFPNVEDRIWRQMGRADPGVRRQVAEKRREMLVEGLDQTTDDVKRYGPAGATAVHAFDFFATGDAARSVVGGVRDAADEVLTSLSEFRHLTGDVQDKLLEAVGVPERFAKLLSPDLELPETGESETVVGQAVRPVVSFLAGFLPLNRALKAAGMAGTLTRDVLASAGAGALTVPHDIFTLADGLAEAVPALGEVIPEFLRSDPGDSKAEAKLKQAANEALGAGVGSALVRPLVAGLRYVRGGSRVRGAAGVPGSAHVPSGPSAKDRLNSWWANNLVSGFSTQALNGATNLVNTMLVPAERIAATTLAHGPRQGLAEARATTWGFMQGLEDAFRLVPGKSLDEQGTVVQAFVKGEGITDPAATKLDPGAAHIVNPPDLRTVFSGGPSAILGNILDTMITSGGTVVGGSRGLITGDEAFKTLLHRMELHRIAAKEGMELGFRGQDFAKYVQDRVLNPDDAMMEQAISVARYGTFTQRLGPKGDALLNFRNEIPLMKFFFPFVRTPSNIFKFALERTPMAPMMKHVREELTSPDPMQRALAMTRVTYGSALMALAAKWTAEGRLTGGGPVDPELRKLMMGDKPPYSVLVGDKWVQHNRAQPWGFLLGFAADLYAISGQIDEGEFDKAFSAGIAGVYRNTLDFPFTQGFAELSNVMHNGFREGDANVVLRQTGDILSTFASPRLVAQLARAEDPTARSARTMLDQLRSQVPGYRADLPVMHDALGDEVLPNEGFGTGNLGVYSRLMVPAVIRKNEDRLRDVREFLQEHEIDVGMPSREIRGIKIDEATYQQVVKRQGLVAVPMVRQLMANPARASLTRPQLESRVKAIFAQARELAKGEVLAGSPELQRRAAALGAGLMEPEALSMQRGMLSTELPQ